METTGTVTHRKRSQLSMIWFRFRKNKLAMLGLIIFLMMILMAVYVSIFGDYERAITMDMPNKLQTPSAAHPFGTDQFGRDILMRMMFGARISLSVGLLTMVLSLVVGSLIGAAAGYYGGRVDNLLMRIMDVFLAIPSTLLAISIVAALGQGMFNLLLATAISQIPAFARVVRSAILTVKGQDYIEAARACGTRGGRVILRHILPNAMGPIIVQATLNIARTILGISSANAGMGFHAFRRQNHDAVLSSLDFDPRRGHRTCGDVAQPDRRRLARCAGSPSEKLRRI